jgi:hypothetical protein
MANVLVVTVYTLIALFFGGTVGLFTGPFTGLLTATVVFLCAAQLHALSTRRRDKRATAKDPAFRYSSAGAFVRAFSGEAADIVPKAHIHRSELAIKERPSRTWMARVSLSIFQVWAISSVETNRRHAELKNLEYRTGASQSWRCATMG